ncbi:Arm DNA-binding domain-containing protein [Caballeronia sp. dw_276]|jgi:hypothetical protein|uniref:Arm DNA-binding domain-containing protein n=1 Tax=Caballeronia sp. dw_276 TaxID=2719795 RepID=UPI001BD24FA5|nr:Arm DNA-binding domain-containing protein [Caballeronia sp. dw_276]
MAKHTINRDFVRAIKATGEYQGFADAELRGFAFKVTPTGGIAYTYRWTKPDGKQGRKVIGHYPEMLPGDAREIARKEAGLIDHKGDTLTVQAERKQKKSRCSGRGGRADLARVFARPLPHLHGNAHEDAARQVQMIAHAFPALLGKTLDAVTNWDLEQWRSAELKKGQKPAT